MFFVRQNAVHKIVIGPVVAVGDGFTPVTTLALTTADEAEAILHDNGTVVDISLYTFAAITTADGYYHLTLQSGISGTVGHVTIVINDDSLCLPVKAEFTVIEEAIYDAMFAASANAFQGAAGSTKVTGVVLVDTLTTYTGNTVQTGDAFARLGAPAGASVSADIAAIEAQTDDIGAAGAGLTAVPWNAAWDAEVQSEVDDALVAQRLDELLNADSDIDGLAPPTVGSVFHELMTKTAGSFTYDQTTDSLEAVRDRGDAAWITATSVTVSDKTGFSLASTGLDLVTTWTVAITGNITGNLSGSVGSVTGAVGSVTGTVGGVAGTITTLDALDTAQDTQHSTTQTSVAAIWTSALTEAYRSTGATGTAAQLLYEILQNLTEFTIASTTKTVKKLDGSTTAKTYTLDDATTPTGITETT